MTSFLTVGIRTGIIHEGDDLADALLDGIPQSEAGCFADGDILVIAESAVATSEGRIVRLDTVIPGKRPSFWETGMASTPGWLKW